MDGQTCGMNESTPNHRSNRASSHCRGMAVRPLMARAAMKKMSRNLTRLSEAGYFFISTCLFWVYSHFNYMETAGSITRPPIPILLLLDLRFQLLCCFFISLQFLAFLCHHCCR